MNQGPCFVVLSLFFQYKLVMKCFQGVNSKNIKWQNDEMALGVGVNVGCL